MSASSSEDSNDIEVGVEWVNDYTFWQNLNGWGDLENCDDDAGGFYDTLGDAGWTKMFNYGNDDAWESDFEKASVGGKDNLIVDGVDFAYFAGHGDEEFLLFSTNHDEDGSHKKKVHYSETRWGDGDLEWIALASCKVLHPDYKDEWIAHACEGKHLHALMGFKTAMPDTPTLGETFADKLLDGKGIKDAWKTATKEECGSGVEAAIIYAQVWYQVQLVHNYALETLPNEGRYIAEDPSLYDGPPGYAVYYSYESWGC